VFVLGVSGKGSFDSVSASLRDALTTLRMTGRLGCYDKFGLLFLLLSHA
jgi:hypothetical protein